MTIASFAVGRMMMADRFSGYGSCRQCRFFVDDPHQLERAFPGILVLSSMYGSTRGDSGICTLRDTFQGPETDCGLFRARVRRFGAVAGDVTRR